jgi:tetratricopeptide (TPR) repeat protein
VSREKAQQLSEVWNVPLARNPNFTGRDSEITLLYNRLTSGGPNTSFQAVSGLGGVGKTQLALEYAYRHAHAYRVVWWLRAEEPATLAADFADLARALNLPGRNDADQRLAIDAVKRWLAEHQRWLLIFDTAREPKDVIPYLSPAGTGHVIVTSRHASWRGVAMPMPVRELSRGESVAFLLKRTGQSDIDSADELAEELGDLPLALAQAGAYMEESGASMSSYIELFKKRQRELLRRSAAGDTTPTVATTWDIAFKEAQSRSPAAAELLSLAAFFAPDDIPRDALIEGSEYLPPTLAEAVRDPFALDDAIAALRRVSLIEVQEESLSVHRLVQAVVRERLPANERNEWAEHAVNLIWNAFPDDLDDVRTVWPVCARFLPHARAATGHAEHLNVAREATHLLLRDAAKYLRRRGAFADSKEFFTRALAIAETEHGPKHPHVATILNGLGVVLTELGDLAAAKRHTERALAIDEAGFGATHPSVARDVNNLARILWRLNDLSGARDKVKRALEIDEHNLGRDHPELTLRLNDLGFLLREMDDLEGAREHLERALKIGEAAYGPENPNVASFLSNLAGVFQEIAEAERATKPEAARKNFEAARRHLTRALAIAEATYGANHYTVALRRNNLGVLLKEMGDLAGAREQLEQALETMKKELGPDHRRVARLEKNLAAVIRQMRKTNPHA